MRFLSPSIPSSTWIKHTAATVCLTGAAVFSPVSQATIVQFQTPMGDFEVNLYDTGTPITVANFLAYVNADAYDNTVIHRSEPNFVIQGGGYRYPGELPLVTVSQNASIENEAVYSNRRGTIAMAKLSSGPNTATNQWFFNLKDNSASLDATNGGYTVFGEVIGDGMDVIDAMAALQRFNMRNAFNTLPLRNYTAADATANVPITDEHLVIIENVHVLNADPDTAAGLNPTPNTLINQSSGGGGGGGSLGLFGLLALGLLALGRKTLLNKA